MTLVSVYAVFADAEEAERIGRAVIDDRLAACVNILAPCRSIYRWEGKIETGVEVPAIFKTAKDQAAALVDRIATLHSYDTPCITVWPIDRVPADYAQWVEDNSGSD
jgi:periplasmic divalent cation tolerance protein